MKRINKSIVNSLLLFSLAVPGYAVISDEQIVTSLREMSEKKVAKLKESLRNLSNLSDRMELINEALDHIIFYDITHSDNVTQVLGMPYNLVIGKGWNSHNYDGKRIGTLDSRALVDLTIPERELKPLLSQELLEQRWGLFFDSISNPEVRQIFFPLEQGMGHYLAEMFLEAQKYGPTCILPIINIPDINIPDLFQKITLCDDEGHPIIENFRTWFRSLYDRFDPWNLFLQSFAQASSALQVIEILRRESEKNPSIMNICSTLQKEVSVRTERAREARAARAE
jgi:hypothetical protein